MERLLLPIEAQDHRRSDLYSRYRNPRWPRGDGVRIRFCDIPDSRNEDCIRASESSGGRRKEPTSSHERDARVGRRHQSF